MLFLRTAGRGFVEAATIVRLCEETEAGSRSVTTTGKLPWRPTITRQGGWRSCSSSCPRQGIDRLRKRRPVGLRAVIAPADGRSHALGCPAAESRSLLGRRPAFSVIAAHQAENSIRPMTVRKMWVTALAGLLLLTGAIAEAKAEGLADAWMGTSWGETPEAVQRHFGQRGFALPQALDFGDSYAPLVVRNIDVGRHRMIAYYQVDKTTHGLKRIQLELPRNRVNVDAFRNVFEALDADYGRPDVFCDTLPGPTTGYQGSAEYVWKLDDMVIRAIFRDTTLEAWGGCYSPACGLTAQLLVRISPPAKDKGSCPPLPTKAQLRHRP